MSVSYKTKILLAYRSGDKCALPDCQHFLTPGSKDGHPINVGEAAHIAGENSGKESGQRSARYDGSMTDNERNHYNNLIYLCRDCHKRIDTIPEGEKDYPVERLHQIKQEHEKKVRKAITEAFADVGFPELQEATEWVAKVLPEASTNDFSLLKLDAKIKKNELDQDANGIIKMGLAVAPDVERYIQTVAQEDDQFPERIRAGFLEEYWRLKKEGLHGGELFEIMCQFAQQGFEKQAKRAAGLGVLIHP